MTRRLIAAISAGLAATALAAPAVSAEAAAPPRAGASVASGHWTAAGHVRGRILTRLRDGRILVCNDRGRGGTAWLYLPRANRWTRTGDLVRRSGCAAGSAALLPGGQVLLAGGIRARTGHRVSVAQVYDPATGRWTLTGRLNEARSDAAVARLPGGQILVIGGYGPRMATGVASTERYDPRTGRWHTDAPMALPRAQASVAILKDHDVLVAGGEGGSLSSERYDVTSGTWLPRVHLPGGDREWGAGAGASKLAVLPSGRVLAVGMGEHARQVDLYRPSQDRWVVRAPLPRAWGYAPMTELSGRPFAIGGFSSRFGCRASTYVYRPAADRWVRGVSMPIPRCSFTAASLKDGSVLVVGGVIDNPLYSTKPAPPPIRFIPRTR